MYHLLLLISESGQLIIEAKKASVTERTAFSVTECAAFIDIQFSRRKKAVSFKSCIIK